MSHRNAKYQATVQVRQLEDRFQLLVEEKRKTIRNSAEYLNFKDPKADEVQARATKALSERQRLEEELRKLAVEENAIRDAAGLYRWSGTEDFSEIAAHMNRRAREDHFASKMQSPYIAEGRLRDAIRAHPLMDVDTLALFVLEGKDLEAIKETLPQDISADDIDI